MKFREEKNLGREVGEEREMEVGIRKGTDGGKEVRS